MAGDPYQVIGPTGVGMVSIRARHRWRAIPHLLHKHPPISDVSIRARHRWRAIQFWVRHAAVVPAVSIRARHRWRAIHAACRHPSLSRMVSIRARHRWRAIPDDAFGAIDVGLFQSAPAIDGGRSRPRPSGPICGHLFQSAPAIDGGRSAPASASRPIRSMFQSAPAIDGGRSAREREACAQVCSFNPRPPSMAGDPRHVDIIAHSTEVSIRARHRWRAIHHCTPRCHPAPEFQSAPAIDGGRSQPRLMCAGCGQIVSIRARHRWRAIPGTQAQELGQGVVSIRARHRWRAIPARCRWHQSRCHVSIRARHRWRAIPPTL